MLAEYLRERDLSQRRFASETGIRQGILSAILAGKRKPTLAQAVKIEEVTEGAIRCRDWLD